MDLSDWGGTGMYAAGYFWSNDSLNMLFSFIGGIIVALLGGWLAYVAGNPRRRISWQVSSGTSLLPDDAPNVQVFSDAVRVDKPKFCRLSIKNDGRKAITPGDFHSGDESLVFDLGQPVISVTPEVLPTSAPKPPILFSRSCLRVGPSLIQPKQVIHLLVLLDGDGGSVHGIASHIVETRVVQSLREVTDEVSSKLMMLKVIGSAVFLVVAALALWLYAPPSGDRTCWAETPEGEKVAIVSQAFGCEKDWDWPW
ncbi:hypothetical protein AB0P07_04650 [Streptomyces sp. NPDC085944]|uniref:hypothetical protein n=1 Tax=Streptomyces sp. NPDC085944 TaxID=3154962 RepID=UPI003438CD31